MAENDPTFASQNEKAKSEIVAQIARIVRRAGLGTSPSTVTWKQSTSRL
jgi:hypothetical protein